MLTWLTANLGTILTMIVLLVIVGLIIHVMIRDKKMGRTSCGNKCSHCAMAGKCHGGAAHQTK